MPEHDSAWRLGAALVGCALLLLIVALLGGCGPSAPAASAPAPVVQADSTPTVAPLTLPADAWTVSVAWTPTPCAAPCAALTPPAEMHWHDPHTGAACSWYASTQQVTCGGAP